MVSGKAEAGGGGIGGGGGGGITIQTDYKGLTRQVELGEIGSIEALAQALRDNQLSAMRRAREAPAGNLP